MDLETLLHRLGFPKHSAAVFEALEKLEPASPAQLVRATKLYRPVVYRVLAALTKAGFAEARRAGKRAVYLSCDRTRIAQAFKGAAAEAQRVLSRGQRAQKSLGMITYHEGHGGIATIFDDVVARSRRGDTFYRYTSERDLDEVNSYLSPSYRSKRDAKRLERLVISNPQSGGRKKKRLERFIKYLGVGKESFSENAIELIYGSRVAFIDLNTARGLIIDNPTLAEFQKTIFRALYKRL